VTQRVRTPKTRESRTRWIPEGHTGNFLEYAAGCGRPPNPPCGLEKPPVPQRSALIRSLRVVSPCVALRASRRFAGQVTSDFPRSMRYQACARTESI
jgi:hypothetical protein